MTGNQIVRNAEPSDASSLAALSMEVWLGTYIRDGVNAFFAGHAFEQFTIERFRERLADVNRTFLVSQNIVGIDGTIELATRSQAPVDGCSDLEIATLYVQSRQGKGKGVALLQAGLDLAKTKGQANVWLTVNAENEGAIVFYERQAFERVGETYYRIGDQSYLNYVMRRDL